MRGQKTVFLMFHGINSIHPLVEHQSRRRVICDSPTIWGGAIGNSPTIWGGAIGNSPTIRGGAIGTNPICRGVIGRRGDNQSGIVYTGPTIDMVIKPGMA